MQRHYQYRDVHLPLQSHEPMPTNTSVHPYTHTCTLPQANTLLKEAITQVQKKVIHGGRYVCMQSNLPRRKTIMSHPLHHTFGHIISLSIFKGRDDEVIVIN